MKDIPEFKLDRIGHELGESAKVQLHGSYPSAFSIQDLINLSGKGNPINPNIPLNYAPSLGSLELRKRLAQVYSTKDTKLSEENVIVTPGSVMANYLVLTTAFAPGDHVICQFPTYGQLYQLPQHLGVDVDLWLMKRENSWMPNISELKRLIKPNTKAIILNNPNNPTGATLGKEDLEKIRDLAKQHDLILIADEVFRPLFHGSTLTPPSVVNLGYTKTMTTGSMSKAYSLPGLRIGWIISPDQELLKRAATARDYTTLNVSPLDDAVALLALDEKVVSQILERNLETCRANIDIIDSFVDWHKERCSWVRPTGAGTAWVRITDTRGQPVDDLALVRNLAQDFEVSIIPGGYSFGEAGVADFKGYVRINLGAKKEDLLKGLEGLATTMQGL